MSTVDRFVPPTARRQLRESARSARETLLGVPLFYKALIANLVLLAAGTAGVAWVMARTFATSIGEAAPLVIGMVLIALAPAGLLNAIILRVVLAPIEELARTARRIQEGDWTARAAVSAVADRYLKRIIELFNGMVNTSVNQRMRLQQLATRTSDAAELERKRISRELHDDVAQSLAAVLVELRAARRQKDAGARDAAFDRVSGRLSEIMEDVGRIAEDLRPPALDLLGLNGAVDHLAREAARLYGFVCTTQTESVRGVLSPAGELALYRVAQEALSNIGRHAAATRARIVLRVEQSGVMLSVSDNGVGFNAASVSGQAHALGLLGMNERVSSFGGTLSIESRPGEGTWITAHIPREKVLHV